MLKLIRTEDGVFYNDRKLTIVAQATKGVGKEVVKIEGLQGSNGAKWISLNKLSMGENVIEPVKREVTSGGKNYELTADEQARVDALQAEIDAIKARARQRYVKNPGLKTQAQLETMSEAERLDYIRDLDNYIAFMKGEAR